MSKGQSAEDLRARMQEIDPYEFEDFVADVWNDRGWETEVSQGSNDMGVDIEAWKSDGLVDQKAVIQAKRYSDGNKVGRPKIQQYHSLKQQDSDADAAVVVTTSEFTRGAEEWADEHNVKLVDGEDLVNIIQRGGRFDLVEKYAPELDEVESSSSTSPSESTSTSAAMPSGGTSDYFGFVALALFAQIVGYALLFEPSAVPALSQTHAAVIVTLGWFSQPVAVFADAYDLHANDADYKPNRLTWPVAVFFVPVIAPLFYIKKRISN